MVTNDNDTALHLACRNGFMEIVNLLLENGVDVNAINRINRTALHEAALNGLNFHLIEYIFW